MSHGKQLDHELQININGKRPYQSDSVKYVGTRIDKNTSWNEQINEVVANLNKAKAILKKLDVI